MKPEAGEPRLDARVRQWRASLPRRSAHAAGDDDAAEAALRAHLAALDGGALDDDERLLLALRRLGDAAAPLRTGARDYALQHLFADAAIEVEPPRGRTPKAHPARVTLVLALLAAASIKLPSLSGLGPDTDFFWYARNLALFVLPWLAIYFAWRRDAPGPVRVALGVGFALAALLANGHALERGGALAWLAILHLPIAAWGLVGVAHAAGRWRDVAARMEFVRFSGEWVVHYVLIALGGIVFVAFTLALFGSLGVDAEHFFEDWLLPCGATGAVLVAAGLVDVRQGFVTGVAPLLTRIFTPLFALLLCAFLAAIAWSGRGPTFQRELLILVDGLLAVVVGLNLYAIAGRDRTRPAEAFDALQLLLVVAALAVDGVALWTISDRIGELGATPNRVAALGENLILLVNLTGTATGYARFLRGRATLAHLERWQTAFLPVYVAWAAVVAGVFPLVFD